MSAYNVSYDTASVNWLEETPVDHMRHNMSLLDGGDAPTNAATLSSEQEHHLFLINYWINGVVSNFVVFLGLVGNLLTIVILSQPAMHSSTNVYLTALAAWDSVVLVGTALLIGLPGIPNLTLYMNYIYPYVVCYIYPLALVAQTATIWLTVSFTVERFIAVSHPLKAASMCTIHRAKVVIGCVSIGALIYNLPRWFEYRTVFRSDPITNQTVVGIEETAFGKNAVYLQVYFSWLYVPIMCCVPLLVLSILNTFLVLAVRKSRRQRKDMNVKQSRENNVTIMLAAVVIVFIVCQVPALVYNLAFAIDKGHVHSSFGYMVLSHLRNFLVNLNSSVNFILYCAMGQKFRRILIHTLCRHCVRDAYMPMSGVHTTTMVSMSSQRRFTANRRDGPGRNGPQRTILANRNNKPSPSGNDKTKKKNAQSNHNHCFNLHAKNNFIKSGGPPNHNKTIPPSAAVDDVTNTPTSGANKNSTLQHHNLTNSRHIHTYTTEKSLRPTLTMGNSNGGVPTAADSDEETPYDISLQLLPDKDNDGKGGYQAFKVDLGASTNNSTVTVC